MVVARDVADQLEGDGRPGLRPVVRLFLVCMGWFERLTGIRTMYYGASRERFRECGDKRFIASVPDS